jgi:hypothetical protein
MGKTKACEHEPVQLCTNNGTTLIGRCTQHEIILVQCRRCGKTGAAYDPGTFGNISVREAQAPPKMLHFQRVAVARMSPTRRRVHMVLWRAYYPFAQYGWVRRLWGVYRRTWS